VPDHITLGMGSTCSSNKPEPTPPSSAYRGSDHVHAEPARAEAKTKPLSRAPTIIPGQPFVDSELENDLDSVDAQMGEMAANGPKCRALIPGKDGSGTISYARSSVKGSRKTNEDNHGAILLDNYAFLLVCDGHGPGLSDVLGATFRSALKAELLELDAVATAEHLVAVLQDVYKTALKSVDAIAYTKLTTGSTITCAILQIQTMRFATLQLGDCQAAVANGITGKLETGELIHYFDSAYPDGGNGDHLTGCYTRDHGFGDQGEFDRMNVGVKEINPNYRILRKHRTDAMPGEERFSAQTVDAHRYDVLTFNEPSRAVENLSLYSSTGSDAAAFARLQRAPEYAVWQLPDCPEYPLLIFICCDGFVSHQALPSLQHTARCITDPEAYMKDISCLDQTCFGLFLKTNSDKWYRSNKLPLPDLSEPAWGQDAVQCCYQLLHNFAPDDTWQRAVQDSYDQITRLRSDHNGTVPVFTENPQAAAIMAVNLAVLLMSDDNVTLEAFLLSPPK